MYRLVRMFCCLIFFLMPLRSWGSPAHPELAPVTTALLTLCGNCQVLVLGETHQKPESSVLFLDLVTQLIAQGERVLVGLEVSAAQQDALDAVLVGNRTPEGIAHPIIDSPSFQNMLVVVAYRKFSGVCGCTPVFIKSSESSNIFIKSLSSTSDRTCPLVRSLIALEENQAC